jgi:hypothetical protein
MTRRGTTNAFPSSLPAGEKKVASHLCRQHWPRYKVFLATSDYAWISKAADVGAERIALMLWRQVGLKRGRVIDITLGNDDGYMRIGKDAKRRQLVALERAGLVTVKRAKGRAPMVTLIGLSGV